MERTVPPLNVSPLIKNYPSGARWGFLIVGILYGSTRYSYLYAQEQKRLAELERTRPEREAKMKLEKKRKDKEIMEELEEYLGNKVS